ncbi:propionyl-coenzyme A carboxylase alpha polypeptide [Mesorhizobium sp. B2-4-12]|nr:propionyl-coenzyme A carboxylase alpha polypeptide [Mesorhizobium sp. B2-4-12]
MRKVGGTAPTSVLPDISPTRGRSDITTAFANHQRRKKAPSVKLLISPLEGGDAR